MCLECCVREATFGRDRLGRRDRGVTLYVSERSDCLELDNGDERVECLRGRIRRKANEALPWWKSIIGHLARMKG